MSATSAQANNVKMCVEHWPPYTIVKNGEVIGGSTVELAREAFTRLGHTLAVDHIPWRRCLEQAKAGIRDVVADVSTTNEFNLITSTHMTSLWSLAIWVRRDDPKTTFESLDKYRGKLVGLVQDYGYPKIIREFRGWDVDFASTDKLNLKKLAAGRIDLAVSDIITTSEYIKEHRTPLRHLLPAIASERLYLGFSPKNRALAKQFDDVMDNIIRDGTADKIYQRYVSEKYTTLAAIPEFTMRGGESK